MGTLAAVHVVHLPALGAAIVLVVSGLAKARRPAAAARGVRVLLRALGVPSVPASALSSFAALRSLGVIEVMVGAGVLATTWSAATWAVAALYAGFAAFVVAALATGAPLQSCGCFGEADAPPSARHVAVDAAVAALAVLAATDAAAGPPRSSLGASSGLGAAAALATAAVLWALLGGATALRPRAARSARGTRA